MHRREYEAIANALRLRFESAHAEGERARAWGVADAALALADTFGELNFNFNRRRFLNACGLEDAQ